MAGGLHPYVDGEEPEYPRLPALKWLLSPAAWVRVEPSASGGPYLIGMRQLSPHHHHLAGVALEKQAGADIIAAPHPPACLVAAGNSTRTAPAKCGRLPPPTVHRHAIDEERRGGRVLATIPRLAAPRLGTLVSRLPLHSGARRLLHSAADGRRWASTQILVRPEDLEEVRTRLGKVEVRTLALERRSRNARLCAFGGAVVVCPAAVAYAGWFWRENREAIMQAVGKVVVDAAAQELKRRRPTMSGASAWLNACTGGWVGYSKEQQLEAAAKKLHEEHEELKRWTMYLHNRPKDEYLWVSTVKYRFSSQPDVSEEEWRRYQDGLKKKGGK